MGRLIAQRCMGKGAVEMSRVVGWNGQPPTPGTGKRRMPARFQLLAFDLDGTLIDSSIDLANATNAAMKALGFPEHNVEEIRSFVGDGARKLVERALPEDRRDLVPRAVEIFMAHYTEHLLDNTRPYEGVEEMLDALSGIPMTIATNKPEGFTRSIIEGLGWRSRFREIIGGDTLPRQKPDAMVIRTICDRMAISPAGTLVIGDGPQDIGAAHNAGAFACGVTWGFRKAEVIQHAGADFLIRHPFELIQAL